MTAAKQKVGGISRGFAGIERTGDVSSAGADIAVVGIPYFCGYHPMSPEIQRKIHAGDDSLSPSAVLRRESMRAAGWLHHFDFDFDADLLAGREVTIVDIGDVIPEPERYKENRERATAAVRGVLAAGAVPVVLGGDNATTIPVIRAYEGYRTICVVQIDAHLDWREERHGDRFGLSSPMRRASEMPWVESMVQIGLRGVGSAGPKDVDDARRFGSVVVRAEEIHRRGMESVLDRIPQASAYHVSFDCDGMEPSLAPGVASPVPGGLTYHQVLTLFRGVARRGRVTGIDFVEFLPPRDSAGLTALTGVRLMLGFIGALAHSGQIGRA